MKRTSHGLTLPNPKLLMLPLWHFLGKLSTRLRNVRDHTQREPWDRRSWPGSFKDCSVKVWTAADFHDWFERGSAWFSIVCERISCKKKISQETWMIHVAQGAFCHLAASSCARIEHARVPEHGQILVWHTQSRICHNRAPVPDDNLPFFWQQMSAATNMPKLTFQILHTQSHRFCVDFCFSKFD